jgi:hypothetical protein
LHKSSRYKLTEGGRGRRDEKSQINKTIIYKTKLDGNCTDKRDMAKRKERTEIHSISIKMFEDMFLLVFSFEVLFALYRLLLLLRCFGNAICGMVEQQRQR